MDSRFWELPVAARVLWVEIFAAAHRRHYAGRLPFDDTRQVALAIGAPLGVVRLHLGSLRAAGLLREVSGGLVAESSAWPS